MPKAVEDIQTRIRKQRRKNKILRNKWLKDPKRWDAEYGAAILALHNLRKEEIGK